MRLEELERELRAERPEIDSDFARKLDDWAAAGFSRGGEPGPAPKRQWKLPTIKPQRWLAPAGGVAVLIALVVGVTSLDPSTGTDDSADGGGEALSVGEQSTPPTQASPDGGGASERQLLQKDVAGVVEDARLRPVPSGRTAHGKIAQDVSLALASSPEDFRNTADGVLDVVDEHGGFVLRSSVSGGDPDVEGAQPGRANFETRIPAGELQAAIASLSDLGHVVSRTDGAKDITNRFNDAKQRIDTYTRARDRLLERLENATTETEQEAIRRQLRIVEAQLADAQDDLDNAQQRVQLVPVSLTVAADSSVTGDDGEWGIGDAFDDAGKVLTVAGGVLVIGAAALLPIAILAFLAWLVADRARQRARERTLDA